MSGRGASVWWVSFGLGIVGCLSHGCARDAAPVTAESQTEGTPPSESDVAEPEPEKSAPEETAQPEALKAPSEDELSELSDTAPREVRYTMKPGGLEIRVAGVRFVTRAEPVRASSGWGVKVSVEAHSDDGGVHSVLAPKRTPLAFAGRVVRAQSTESLSDRREGDEALEVVPDRPVTISRVWPGGGKRGLGPGESLELEVGLWGVGDDASNRRPVEQFFKLAMKAGHKRPQPVISPPPSVTQ
jgi:hypothetical protein